MANNIIQEEPIGAVHLANNGAMTENGNNGASQWTRKLSRRNRRFAIAFCLIFTLLFTGCNSTSTPTRITEKYFSAVKSGDVEKAIECFPPVFQEQWELGRAVYNSLLGAVGVKIDSGTLLNAWFGTVNEYYYRNYDFQVVDSSQIDSTHATVTVDVYIDGYKSCSTTISCTKIDREWFVEP